MLMKRWIAWYIQSVFVTYQIILLTVSQTDQYCVHIVIAIVTILATITSFLFCITICTFIACKCVECSSIMFMFVTAYAVHITVSL